MPCYQRLATDPRFAPIKDKVALSGKIEDVRRLPASAERASPQESPVLMAWRDAREACSRLEEPYLATRDLEIAAAVRKYFATVQGLIAELSRGKMTYGEFGKRRIDLYEKLDRDIEQLRKDIVPPKQTPHTVGGK